MAHLTPIRDAAGGIIGLQGDESQFSATLAETMSVVGSAPAAATTASDLPRPERHTLAMIACGLVTALALVGALSLLQRPMTASQPPRGALTAVQASPTPRTIRGYWSPGGAAIPALIDAADAHHFIGRMGDEWAQVRLPGGGEVWVRVGDLVLDQADMEALAAAPDRATPTPTPPTPIVIVRPPVQCWTITLDVTDGHGTPIGIATGESCESRDAAQANAEAQAEQVRATHEKR